MEADRYLDQIFLMRLRRGSATRSGLFRTRETVAGEVRHSFAISEMVYRGT